MVQHIKITLFIALLPPLVIFHIRTFLFLYFILPRAVKYLVQLKYFFLSGIDLFIIKDCSTDSHLYHSIKQQQTLNPVFKLTLTRNQTFQNQNFILDFLLLLDRFLLLLGNFFTTFVHHFVFTRHLTLFITIEVEFLSTSKCRICQIYKWTF